MEIITNSSVPATQQKFYTDGSILGGTFLGGPLAGGYFLSKNFKGLGNESAAKKAFWGGIATIVISAVLLGITPASVIDKLPNSALPIIYIICIYFIYQRLQKQLITERLASSAEKQSVWKALGISLLCTVITIVIFVAIMFPLEIVFGS
ncbi:hypothetical protein C4585_01715 [Candidatus Parcubacteria bacterium]|nr:MAG: hypothetical protein C4585_01715 [Candidatus Parcubacteria bacterium]